MNLSYFLCLIKVLYEVGVQISARKDAEPGYVLYQGLLLSCQ